MRKELLEKQKKGKALMKEKGRVNVPSKTFLDIFRTQESALLADFLILENNLFQE